MADDSPTERRKQTAQEVVIEGTKNGLGIRIVGGRNITSEQQVSDFGIFVKEIIPKSLAANDGRLERGDQLLEANGTSLIGVSNDRAVAILKTCAASDKIILLVSRDVTSQTDFRRLSTSLVTSQTPLPMATSTPYAPETGLKKQSDYSDLQWHSEHASVVSDATGTVTDTAAYRSSTTSSELTQISTTDISSHGDDLDEQPETEIGNLNSNMNNAMEFSTPVAVQHRSQKTSGESANGSIAQLSDVVVTVPGPPMAKVASRLESVVQDGKLRPQSLSSEESIPPPLPVSAPPPLEYTPDESLVQLKKREPSPAETAMASAGSTIPDQLLRSSSPPEGKASVSPPLSASLPSAPIIHNIAIQKTAGLGIIIAGGTNRPDGPHIYVDKILEGMDAARDGRLKKRDRILTVNGENFSNLPRERALTILTQLKIRPHVKAYTMSIERSPAVDAGSDSGPPSLPEPSRTTIFDSDTLTTSEAEFSESEHKPLKPLDTPDVYYKQSADAKLADYSTIDPSWSKEGSGVKFSTPPRYLTKKEPSKTDSLHKRMSMDPNSRVKLSKLVWALNYMGHIITPQQQEQIQTTLEPDENGKVVFADFVELAQDMFSFHLDDSQMEANLVYALTQKEGMDLPNFPRKATSADQLWREYSPGSSGLKLASSQPLIPQTIPYDTELLVSREEAKLNQMRQQLHELGNRRDREKLSESVQEQEVAKLKLQLKQKDHELQLLRQVPLASSGDSHAIRNKLSLTEAVVKASREKENQMEDTLRCMEAELSALREQNNESLSSAEQRRRLAAIDCELRKERTISRRFQVATERLILFVENCHEALVTTPEADRIVYHHHGKGEAVQRGDVVTGNPRPPQYLSRHAKVTSTTLAKEAQDTIAAVRKMLEVEDLPFGWEEAHTEDGVKYYMNHVTQTTSWVHPTTKVNPNVHSRSHTPASGSHTSSQKSLDNIAHPIEQHA